MSVNSVNGAQPKLYTFAEMEYAAQNPINSAPAAVPAAETADTVEIADKKPKKKISKGVIATVTAVAIAALAAFGLAKSGQKSNEAAKLFTKSNFAEGFANLKGFVTNIPARAHKFLAHIIKDKYTLNEELYD